MKNSLRVVFLAIIGFGFLIYFTLPKNSVVNKSTKELDFRNLPSFFDVVNANNYTKKDEFFKSFPLFLIVLNHDSLAIFNELYKKDLKENIIFIANISNTPWLIKQIAVNGELEKMYKNSTIPIINDSNGAFINSLDLSNSSQNGYFVYKIDYEGKITNVFEGSVKKGALQSGISKENIEEELKIFLENFKNIVNL